MNDWHYDAPVYCSCLGGRQIYHSTNRIHFAPMISGLANSYMESARPFRNVCNSQRALHSYTRSWTTKWNYGLLCHFILTVLPRWEAQLLALRCTPWTSSLTSALIQKTCMKMYNKVMNQQMREYMASHTRSELQELKSVSWKCELCKYKESVCLFCSWVYL